MATRDGLELTLKPRHWPFHPYPLSVLHARRACASMQPFAEGRLNPRQRVP